MTQASIIQRVIVNALDVSWGRGVGTERDTLKVCKIVFDSIYTRYLE